MSLTIANLSKEYDNGVKAVKNLSLNIGTGMFGLLGPNGAGKSTLMRTIATLQTPDTGSINFKDIDVLESPMQLRKILGYLPQSFGVYPKVSAINLLQYLATLKGIHDKGDRNNIIDKVLEITNLQDVSKKHVSSYSGGMKQRFGIAQLLLNNPQLIIVDEPTAGLDPAERNRFLNILREIGTRSTVIFSTHIVDDVRDLCTDMAIMNQGKILRQVSPEIATNELNGHIWTTTIDREELEAAKTKYQVLSSGYTRTNDINIRVYSDTRPGDDFTATVPDLEDVYFLAVNI